MVVYNCYIGHVAGLLPLRSRAAAGSSERRRRGWACVCVCCGGEDPGSATGAAAGSLMESAPMSHGPWRGRPIYKCSGAGGRTCAPLDMNFSISSGGMYPCAAAPGVSAPRGLADAAASGGGRPRQKEAGWGWRRERAQSGQVAGGRCSRRSGRWQQRVRTRAAGEGGGAQQQKTWRQGGLLPGGRGCCQEGGGTGLRRSGLRKVPSGRWVGGNSQLPSGSTCAVGESSVILLQTPLPSVGVSTGMERGCQ